MSEEAKKQVKSNKANRRKKFFPPQNEAKKVSDQAIVDRLKSTKTSPEFVKSTLTNDPPLPGVGSGVSNATI